MQENDQTDNPTKKSFTMEFYCGTFFLMDFTERSWIKMHVLYLL